MKIKFILLLLIVLLVSLISQTNAQIKSIPSVKIKNLKGESIDTKTFGNNGQPFLIVFFSSCCSPSFKAMEDLQENYELLHNKYNLKIIAISIDDSRNSKKVAPMAKGSGWHFDIYLDENSDFKRAMGINNKPHFILFNKNGEAIWQKAGYLLGIIEEFQIVLDKERK